MGAHRSPTPGTKVLTCVVKVRARRFSTYHGGAVREVLRSWDPFLEGEQHAMHEQDNIRTDIRLLGGFEVVRPDGTAVTAAEWRTGKTMDLLRLLALSNARPVRTAGLIDKLWPDASPGHGRGSLRTAASQIRRTVGADCVVRQPDGLALRGAHVDVDEFMGSARRVFLAARAGDHARVIAIARHAERVYLGDFHAYDDDSDWAAEHREYLRRMRLALLCDAASSAETMHLYQEAADLAAAAIQIDRSSEAAHRILMAAHAGLGEIAGALRVYETYRAHLAEELGVNPSPQTRDLHLRLLRDNSA